MKERKGTFWKILLTLLILGGLGYGGWYAYGRFFAEVPQEGTVFVQSVATITGVGAAGVNNRYSGMQKGAKSLLLLFQKLYVFINRGSAQVAKSGEV